MDRRVFQPREDNSAARRRSAIGMALAALVGCLLAMQYLKANSTAPTTVSPPKESHALDDHSR